MNTTDVVIVGGGPAGLAMAMELGAMGIRAVLIERRTEPDPHPRASLLGARSMEYFRRHRVADEILHAGLPTKFRYDVRFVTKVGGDLIHHYWSPSPDEYTQMHLGKAPPTSDSTWSPYFKVQIGQHSIEPILRSYIDTLPSIQTLFGWEVTRSSQTDDCVRVCTRELETGREVEFEGQYLVACDGARGSIREQLGITHVGRGPIGRNRSYLFQATRMNDIASTGRANLHFVFQPNFHGVVTDLDGKGLFNFSHFDPSPEQSESDGIDILRTALAPEIDFKVLRTLNWSHHQSVAERMRDERVFLVGDAAHLFSPSGGIGMNTAIADAFELGWKLAAVVGGWGGSGLLDSYDFERWPIAFRNTQFGSDNRDRIEAVNQLLPSEIADHTADGNAAREKLRTRFEWLARQFSSMGSHLGARFLRSPIISYDESPEPPDDPRIVTQTTWPGSRAPHKWITSGRSTLDAYDGKSYTLVSSGSSSAAASMVDAARDLGIPLSCISYNDPEINNLHERCFVLVRPDGIVCWRGDELPDSPSTVLRKVSGNLME